MPSYEVQVGMGRIVLGLRVRIHQISLEVYEVVPLVVVVLNCRSRMVANML